MSAPQEQETIPASGPQNGDFDVLYRGRSVELVVRPPGPDGRPVTADQVLAALEDSPLDTIPTPHVQAAVTKRSSLPVSLGDVEVPAGSMDPCVIKLALNNLAAYAVPSSPHRWRSRHASPDRRSVAPGSARRSRHSGRSCGRGLGLLRSPPRTRRYLLPRPRPAAPPRPRWRHRPRLRSQPSPRSPRARRRRR